MSGFRIGRLLGIELRLHPSLLIIFLLVVFNLGAGVLPAWHPDWSAALVWGIAIAAAVLFFASVVLHELAHSVVAKAYGMKVESITLFLFGGVSNIEEEPPTAAAEFWMAIVGPLASIFIGVVALVAAAFVAAPVAAEQGDTTAFVQQLGPLATLLAWLGPINLLVGLFNMLPGFPLDGGRVLRAILRGITGDMTKATRWAAGVGRVFGWTLMAIGVAMAFGITVPILGSGLIGGLWMVFIGWFLGQAANASYTQIVVQDLLEGVSVERLMNRDVVPVPAGTSIERLVRDFLEPHDQETFPVVDGPRLVGLVHIDDVRRVARDRWRTTRVDDVMTPRDALEVTAPGEPAVDAMKKLTSQQRGELPVVDQGDLLGMLRNRDITRWLQLNAEDLLRRQRHA